MTKADGITIKDAISKLRIELQDAVQAAGGEALRLKVDEIELELSLTVERSAGANGEISWWVVKAGGEVAQANTATHKVTLTLSAGDLFVGDSRATQ